MFTRVLHTRNLNGISRDCLLESVFFIVLLLTGDFWFLPRNTIAAFVRLFHEALMVLFLVLYVPRPNQRKLKNPIMIGALVLYWFVNYLRVPGVTAMSILNIIILIYFCDCSLNTQITTYRLFRKLFVIISFN